jgi:uncharacterized protein (TIGR04222 family)
MSRPWGLTDLEFLGVYGAGIVLTLIIPLVIWQLARRLPVRGVARELNPYEVGYLAGGPSRVAEVIIAEQVQSGSLRVNSAGRLSKPKRQSKARRESKAGRLTGAKSLPETVGWVALTRMPDERSAGDIRSRLSSDPGMAEIDRDLHADKMLVSSSWMGTLRRVAVALPPALLITGILRAIYMAGYHGLGAAMIGLMFAGIMIDIGMLGVVFLAEPPLTSLGSARLKRLRQARANAPSPVLPDSTVAAPAGEAVLVGVALDGYSAIPDEDIRKALVAGTWPRSSGSGFRDSSDGCGVGHGCGHGCGGNL